MQQRWARTGPGRACQDRRGCWACQCVAAATALLWARSRCQNATWRLRNESGIFRSACSGHQPTTQKLEEHRTLSTKRREEGQWLAPRCRFGDGLPLAPEAVLLMVDNGALASFCEVEREHWAILYAEESERTSAVRNAMSLRYVTLATIAGLLTRNALADGNGKRIATTPQTAGVGSVAWPRPVATPVQEYPATARGL
jgi:hypothetical protein